MSFKQGLEKSLIKFGENNSPAVIAMGIAAAKGIFRPISTMADKKQDYETKRYTALREGLTEVIAIPIYYLSGVLSKVLAKKLSVPKNFMGKDIYEKSKAGDMSEEVLNAVKKAENLAKDNLPKIQITLGFIGACLSALLIIPLVCSITIKPFMRKHQNKKHDTIQAPLSENNVDQQTFKRRPVFKQTYYKSNTFTPSMKVGSV